MEEINFILPALDDLVQLNNGCCCEVTVVGHGYAYGTKLVVSV